MTYSLQPRNVAAFLDTIAWSELGSDYLKRSDDGYNVIVTGIDGKLELFTDYSDHPFANGRPSKLINSKGLKSSASGRYQFMLRDWAHYKRELAMPDFGKVSQDRWAIKLVKERRAFDDVLAGRVDDAIMKCGNIWASFPNNNYGQKQHKLDVLVDYFRSKGGFVI